MHTKYRQGVSILSTSHDYHINAIHVSRKDYIINYYLLFMTRIYQFSFLVLLLFMLCDPLAGLAQTRNKEIKIECKNERLPSTLKKLEKLSGYKILFTYDDINQYTVNGTYTGEVMQVLKAIIGTKPLEVSVDGQYINIVLREKAVKVGQSILHSGSSTKMVIVRGRVLDSNHKPLPGVNIVDINNKQNGTVSRRDGSFMIPVQRGGTHSLYFSFVGMKNEIVSLQTDEDKDDVAVTMREDAKINEVVVTGIFNKPKVSFTGAATTITKAELEQTGTRNLMKSLTFLDPSFDVLEANQRGSDPNQTLNIEIRGSSSIGNVSDLQTNVRNQRNLPLFVLDGFEVTAERVMDMNQSDVESVVILKDASATAIYGSRGANGVVVITSVQPKEGKLRVSYQAGINLEIPDLSSYNLLNSFEKIELEKVAGLYTGSSLTNQLALDAVYNQNLRAANEGVNTDWIHKPVQTGIGQYHRADVGGGTDQFRYVLNFSYNQITGAMKGSNRNNLNGGMTINYLLKNLRLSNNLSVGFNNGANSNYGTFSAYTTMNPYWRPYDADGKPVMSYYNFGSTYATPNPLYDAAQTSFSTTNYTNIRNTTMLDIDITKGLRINASIGFTQQRGGTDAFTSPNTTNYTVVQTGLAASDRGLYYMSISEQNSYQASLTANWAKVIGNHTIYVGINGQMMQTQSNRTQMGVKGFMNDEMTDISDGNSYSGTKPSTNESTVRSAGATGTINYNYNNMYFVDASYRLDGASSFGKYSRWAPFWSIGLGWEIAKEKLVQKYLPILTGAKVRYSYGVTGSLNFDPYQALTTYQYNTTNQYNYLVGALIQGYGNPNLKWQNTQQHDVGLDLMLGDRFTLNANYYNKTTDNLLSDVYLPLSHGYTSYKENLGSVRNTGYDLLVSYAIVKDTKNDFNLTLRGGLYHNANTLLKLSDAIKRANQLYESQFVSNGSAFYQYKEGHSMDELYVLHSVGVDPATGERLYQSEDGTVSNTTTGMKKIAVGSQLPKFNGRFGATIRWKGITADMNFGLRLGAKKLNSTLLTKVENAYAKINVDRRAYTERWRKPGDISAYKNIASTNNTYENDLFVFTERTFTFNTVNIVYELPRRWISKLKMERLAISGAMSDILYISNIEQERGTDYPYSIKPNFTLSCTF